MQLKLIIVSIAFCSIQGRLYDFLEGRFSKQFPKIRKIVKRSYNSTAKNGTDNAIDSDRYNYPFLLYSRAGLGFS